MVLPSATSFRFEVLTLARDRDRGDAEVAGVEDLGRQGVGDDHAGDRAVLDREGRGVDDVDTLEQRLGGVVGLVDSHAPDRDDGRVVTVVGDARAP
jgi:hypothetical protein